MQDPKKPPVGQSGSSPFPPADEELDLSSTVDDFFARLHPDMRRPLPTQDAIAAALQTMQRLAAEAAADAGADSSSRARATVPCEACGHQNRPGNQFCGKCGRPLALSTAPPPGDDPSPSPSTFAEPGTLPGGQHHYHHHYHHHYVTPGQEAAAGLASGPAPGNAATARLRSPGAGGTLSRVEVAVRKVMLDWAAACNTRHLDDLVSTYSSDALVLRPNHPAVRGAAAIREFFFATLDAGFGEVEIEPLRVDVIGDVAYEAGRCKMLVPVAVSKRREERGKYLAVLARQANGEWRIVSDCWSSDLSLSKSSEPDPKAASPAAVPPRPVPPRKGP